MNPKDRQQLLKQWLVDNFQSGRYYSIEEVVASVVDENGDYVYRLNKNPYNHDKCAVLSNDVRQINWSVDEGWKIIIKDTKGGIKLCETEEEFKTWKEHEKEPVERKCKYLNQLVFKVKRNGEMPFLDGSNNPVPIDNLKPIESFGKANG